jgi:acyl carrier protein
LGSRNALHHASHRTCVALHGGQPNYHPAIQFLSARAIRRRSDFMTTRQRLLALLDRTLNLAGRSSSFTDATVLMGSVPELDSMGVVSLLTAFEEQFGFSVEDDEIDGSVFETFGTLLAFVEAKLAE